MQRIPAHKLKPAILLARPQHHISGRISPSGRFTLGTLPKSPPQCKHYRRSQDEETTLPDLPSDDNTEAADAYRQLSLLCQMPEVDTGVEAEGREAIADIGSSNAAISHKRGKPGSRGISGKSADQLKYWLTQFESRWGRDRISFLTLTVPTVSEGDRRVIQDEWSDIVRRFVQELKREIVRRGGISTDVLGCTEIQPERSQREGWDVPHLHLVFCGRVKSRGGWLFRPEEIRGLWKRVLSGCVDCSSIDFRATENIQRVRYSCARYLSKYLSKSSSKSKATVALTQWHPSSYVVLPAKFRQWFRGTTAKGFDVALYILEVMKVNGEIEGFWMSPITIKTSIGDQVMGWVGYNPEWVRNAPSDIWGTA